MEAGMGATGGCGLGGAAWAFAADPKEIVGFDTMSEVTRFVSSPYSSASSSVCVVTVFLGLECRTTSTSDLLTPVAPGKGRLLLGVASVYLSENWFRVCWGVSTSISSASSKLSSPSSSSSTSSPRIPSKSPPSDELRYSAAESGAPAPAPASSSKSQLGS